MTRRRWTDAEDAMLRERFATCRTRDLAETLGRSYGSVAQRAAHLGLGKAPEWMATPASGRAGDGRGASTRFAPGLVPWNKGLKGFLSSPATLFRAGQKNGRAAQLEQPIGSYRVNAEGYLERKVSDLPGPARRRWRSVHRLVWEAAHGPVAHGMCVVFRGPRTTVLDEITLDRLECISQAELMARNTLHRHGPEIAKLVQLRGQLTRTINRRLQKDRTP